MKDRSENEVFSFAADWKNNAVINVFHGHDERYISGYREAVQLLTNYVLENTRGQDTLVFPIVFLFRHYIELRLKKLFLLGREILGQDRSFTKNHGIEQYAKDIVEISECIARQESLSVDEVLEKTDSKNLKFLIKEFSDVDPNSQAFRYSEAKSGNKSLDGITYVNIRNFADKIKVIDESLSKIEGFYSMIFDSRSEC